MSEPNAKKARVNLSIEQKHSLCEQFEAASGKLTRPKMVSMVQEQYNLKIGRDNHWDTQGGR